MRSLLVATGLGAAAITTLVSAAQVLAHRRASRPAAITADENATVDLEAMR